MRKKLKDIYFKYCVAPFLERYGFEQKNKVTEQDIILAGYPKSGNTWLSNVLASVYYGLDGQYLPQNLSFELVPPIKGRPFYKRFTSPMIFKTHELPKEGFRKVVLLVRDGRDVIVSYKKMKEKQNVNTSYKEMIIDGKGIYPCRWHEYYKQWEQNPYNADIYLVRFEDLKSDTFKELNLILNFLDIQRSPEAILKAIEGNSLDQMKRKEKLYGHNNNSFKGKSGFFRKGQSGNYENEIDAELLSIFKKESHELLEKYNYL